MDAICKYMVEIILELSSLKIVVSSGCHGGRNWQHLST